MNARRIIGPPFPEKDTRLPVTSTYATSEQPARMRRIGVLIAIAILKEIRSMEDKEGTPDNTLCRSLVLLRHKLRRERPFILRRERRFDLAPQHGQRDRISTSLATSRRRMVAMEFGTCRSGRSGGSSGSVTFGKGKLREENFGNRS